MLGESRKVAVNRQFIDSGPYEKALHQETYLPGLCERLHLNVF